MQKIFVEIMKYLTGCGNECCLLKYIVVKKCDAEDTAKPCLPAFLRGYQIVSEGILS